MRNSLIKLSLLYCTLFLTLSSRADSILVPTIIIISVNSERPSGQFYNSLVGPSKLVGDLNYGNIKGRRNTLNDYEINGAIYTNCPNSRCSGSNGIFVEVTPNPVKLTNGSSEIIINLQGNIGDKQIRKGIGKTSINLKKSPIPTNLGWQADIQVNGNIDSNSLSFEDRPGVYTGTFTIEASKI